MNNEISLARQQEIFGALTESMPPEAIEWRVQTAGQKGDRPWAKVVPYADARWLMQRLDDVFGPMGWWNEYEAGPSGGVLCKLTVTVDGVSVTKQDGAENTQVESVKGGITDAFKRACVLLNVGNIRALYGSGEHFADINQSGQYYQPKDRSGNNRYPAFKWDPPRDFRLPESAAYTPHPAQSADEDESDELDLSGPATKEQKDQIINLRIPLSPHLTEAQKEKISEAIGGTEEQAAKTIEWLMQKSEEVLANV